MSVKPFASLSRLRQRWRRLEPFIGATRSRIAILTVASVASGFAEGAILLLVVQLALAISTGQHGAPVDLPLISAVLTVPTLLVAAVALVLVRLLLQFISAYLPARMSADVQGALRERLTSAYLHANWPLQSSERDGRLQDLLTNQAAQAAQVVFLVSEGASSFLNFSALMLAAVLLNPLAAGGILVAVAFLFVLLRPLAKRSRAVGTARSRAALSYAEAVSETVRLVEEIQVFGVCDRQQDRVRVEADRVDDAVFKGQFLMRFTGALYQSIALTLVLAGLGLVYATGSRSLTSLGAVVLILVRGLSYAQGFQSVYQRANDLAPEVSRVISTLDGYEREARPAGVRPLDKIDSIAFAGVSFGYRRSAVVLDDVSFVVQRGEMIGVVGPSGAGKSTLVQLLLRLRTPTVGSFAVNGAPASDYCSADWERAVAYLPQESNLLTGTAFENIAFLRPGITPARAEQAAKRAGIHDDIVGWSHGYHTVVGQRMDAISGGERQRLCLARALASDPRLLILDEPTSALDPRSESIVQESLSALHGEVTIFVIAHRMSTLSACNRIMVIGNGKLEAFSSAEELLESNEFYRRSIQIARS